MVLNIQLFRTNPDLIRESQRRRFKPIEDVDAVIQIDLLLKQRMIFFFDIRCLPIPAQHKFDLKRSEINKIEVQIRKTMNADESNNNNQIIDQDLNKQKTELEAAAQEIEKNIVALKLDLHRNLRKIGNLVHDTVPYSKDEKDNTIVTKWGNPVKEVDGFLHHHELLLKLDALDMERGSDIAGHRAYFLKG